ncbi:MAG: radical SAM protein [Oceanicaulis sp.]
MAELILDDVQVVLNSVDLTDHVKSVSLTYSAEEQDRTAMGDGARRRIGGLKDFTATLNFNQDFDAGSVDATLFSAVGSVVALTMTPKSGSVSATNPRYSGNVLVRQYSPLEGSVGDLAETSVELPGDGVLSRLTS